MADSIHDYVVSQLERTPLSQVEQIALATGVNESTIRKIKYRHTENPGVSFIERLNKYFRERPQA